MLSLQEIITATGGHCENMQELIFTGITTDSRIESSGELFVALCGERFDGHAYCNGVGTWSGGSAGVKACA